MNKSILSALFFCAVWAIAQPVCAGEKDQSSVFEGVMLTGLYGEEVAIDSLLDKGPLVINFWATWCSPCKLEMPHLEKLYREFAPKGVQFAAVSVDMKRNAGRVKTFLEKQELTVPAYIDHDTRLAKGFNVRAIPTTIIILPDRSQYHRNKGYRPGDEVLLRKHLQAILESAGDEGDDMAGEAGEDGEGGEADKAAGRGAAPGEAAVRTEPEPARETGD